MRRSTPREKRFLAYFAILVVAIVWNYFHRRWSPDITITTDHYTVYSTATTVQTREIGIVAEILHAAYMKMLDELKVTPQSHGTLKVKLFKDRDEFRFCNNVMGWAEAFYSKPYCYQYYSAEESNPYHWMIHEATHQLNEEVAGFSLEKWLEEGLADYFGTSRIISNELVLGEIDTNTYPVWWIYSLATSSDLESDKKNASVIPLQSIISGKGGPGMNKFFNLYYLHWWSLTHFLFHGENGKYRHSLRSLVKDGGSIEGFERYVGDIEKVELEWYAHVLALKRELIGKGTPPTVLTGTDRKLKLMIREAG